MRIARTFGGAVRLLAGTVNIMHNRQSYIIVTMTHECQIMGRCLFGLDFHPCEGCILSTGWGYPYVMFPPILIHEAVTRFVDG